MAAFRRIVVLFVLVAVTAHAQPRPDFSGTWTLDAAASTGLNDDERERGVTVRVRQTDRDIVVERQLTGGPVRAVRYSWDGGEASSRAGSVTVKARSRWEGDRLLTSGTQTASVALIRISATFDEVRYLNDDGKTMVQDSTFLRGGQSTKRRLVFRRAP